MRLQSLNDTDPAFAENDSDDGKGSVQTRHTQTAFSSTDRKNYRQEANDNCCP